MTVKREMTDVLRASPLFGRRLLASRCRYLWVASVLPGFYLHHDDFAHDLFALHGKIEAFAGVGLLSHGQVLLVSWSRSWRLSSWDSTVSSFTPFIAIRFVLNKLQVQTKLHSRKSVDVFFGARFFQSLLWLVFPRHPMNVKRINNLIMILKSRLSPTNPSFFLIVIS